MPRGQDSARQAAREIDQASDIDLDRSMVPQPFIALWTARRAAKAHGEICVMRGIPGKVLARRAAQIVEAIAMEYTR